MAKKHIFTLLSLLSLFAYANAQEQVGEISDDSVSAEPTYPLRYNSYQPEYAERMTKLDYETILEEIDEKRAKAKKRQESPELQNPLTKLPNGTKTIWVAFRSRTCSTRTPDCFRRNNTFNIKKVCF